MESKEADAWNSVFRTFKRRKRSSGSKSSDTRSADPFFSITRKYEHELRDVSSSSTTPLHRSRVATIPSVVVIGVYRNPKSDAEMETYVKAYIAVYDYYLQKRTKFSLYFNLSDFQADTCTYAQAAANAARKFALTNIMLESTSRQVMCTGIRVSEELKDNVIVKLIKQFLHKQKDSLQPRALFFDPQQGKRFMLDHHRDATCVTPKDVAFLLERNHTIKAKIMKLLKTRICFHVLLKRSSE